VTYHGPVNALARAVGRIWELSARPGELAPRLLDIARAMEPVVEVGLGRLEITRVPLGSGHSSTVVVSLETPEAVVNEQIADLGPVELERLVAWCRSGDIAAVDRGAALPAPLSGLVSAPVARARIVASLPVSMSDLVSFAVASAPSGRSFSLRHVRSFDELWRAPLALATERDEEGRRERALEQGTLFGRELVRAGDGDHDGLSDRIIGADRGLRPVMERVSVVARSDVPVLILGETGSGKEIIARAIHAQSPRADAPFIRVNCGAIAPDLLDSELFGHEKGSFTGAATVHRGLFERAHMGTLFLDEIGELPLPAQVRLLRVLQDGSLRRVGSESSLTVDVRVVAATHRDLASMVRDGAFREDLWYRLAVFPIDLPPLRAHPEDIPAMAEFFARRAAARFDLPLRLPTAADLRTLSAYDWPGNVRELGAVIDRAVLLGRGRTLEIAAALGGEVRVARASATPPTRASDVDADRVAPLEVAVRRHVEHALRVAGGRIEGPHGAARLLAVNPHTLRARMRKLGIDWTAFRAR
jgi:hydrogenase-4 transcriptional activator